MKHIQSWGIWEAKITGLSKEQKDLLNKCVFGKWEYDPQNDSVNIEGNFILDKTDYNMENLLFIKFKKVTGEFVCINNWITSLQGFPEEVGGSFDVHNNKLTSLRGGPKKVGGQYDCRSNRITDLTGAPSRIKKTFNCSENQLASLEGGPKRIDWDFYCNGNKLSNLIGGPEKVKGEYNCYGNNLTSIEGIPIPTNILNCFDNKVDDLVLHMIKEKLNQGIEYGAALLLLRKLIGDINWDILDKSSIERLTSKQKSGYNLISRIEG